MVQMNSRWVESNQAGPHDKLLDTVRRHLGASFRKPISTHTAIAFERAAEMVAKKNLPLILDACCGVGDSTRALAARFPDHFVLGVDKSDHRLNRERTDAAAGNMMLLRADLNDFYRLAEAAGWRPDRHYILYPNPWPKAEHLTRRWHGAPVCPSIIRLGGHLELRSNWKIYLEEFALALGEMGQASELTGFDPVTPITPFERKYHESGQPLWRLTASLV
jgi:tRNA (guanine-N7-)-methyltransferase